MSDDAPFGRLDGEPIRPINLLGSCADCGGSLWQDRVTGQPERCDSCAPPPPSAPEPPPGVEELRAEIAELRAELRARKPATKGKSDDAS